MRWFLFKLSIPVGLLITGVFYLYDGIQENGGHEWNLKARLYDPYHEYRSVDEYIEHLRRSEKYNDTLERRIQAVKRKTNWP